uniref:Uncharacterized protein n=1 Tax=Avena sativa TaxID=4498 RepID=A0ACD6ALD8_AVESA
MAPFFKEASLAKLDSGKTRGYLVLLQQQQQPTWYSCSYSCTSSSSRAMAGSGTPEDFLGQQQQGFLARLEPPSPSLFLDLPPTPRCEEDGDAAFDDMALPYISRLLMEEEGAEDHFFFLYPDHPALLRAQQPFAQILVHSATSSASALSPSSSSSDATASASSASPHDGVQFSSDGNYFLPSDQDMLNLAFLKGMEEAQKFLPVDIGSAFAVTDKEVVVAGGGLKKKRDSLETESGRPTKFITPGQEEEDGSRDLFDEMMFQEHEICMKGIQQLRIPVDVAPPKASRKGSGKRGRPRKGVVGSEMVDLHTLLLHCAEALSTDNRRGATDLLKRIKENSSPLGDAAQRLAHYFAEGLEARLAVHGKNTHAMTLGGSMCGL